MIRSEEEFLSVAKTLFVLQSCHARLQAGDPIEEVMQPTNAYETSEDGIAWTQKYITEAQAQMLEYDKIHNGDRKGQWMPLYSGRRFWPEDPRPRDIHVRDIAHCLARINRFNGHTRESYSVAQHSVMVSSLVPEEFQLFALLHDAGECYLGDVITPVKRLIREFYEPIEEKVMGAVAECYHFEMSEEARKEVKKADLSMLYTEIRDLCPAQIYNGSVVVPPVNVKIDSCWSAELAEIRFIEMFIEHWDFCAATRGDNGKKAI